MVLAVLSCLIDVFGKRWLSCSEWRKLLMATDSKMWIGHLINDGLIGSVWVDGH